MKVETPSFLSIDAVRESAAVLENVITRTPLQRSERLSEQWGLDVFLKREDLQVVRSYKIRGAYHKIASTSLDQQARGVVCASAGNHAQGVALSCKLLKIEGTIFMPSTTPSQKIDQVRIFGGEFVEIQLVGDTFDEAFEKAELYAKEKSKVFVHPFEDEKVIEGQATVGLEIWEQSTQPIDYIILPIGGGGLAAGVSSVLQKISPNTKIIGVEPAGAPAMKVSLQKDENTRLDQIEKFVDGAAVHRVGDLNFSICKQFLDRVITVDEGLICETILELYNRDAMVVEPAGAMSIAALEQLAPELKDKRVVCVVSGGNNDITRTAEIKERALLYSNLKHYFIIKFPQRAGALREFVAQILGPNDDITHFEYTKKTNRENGAAVVGLELASPKDFEPLVARMKASNFYGDYLNNKPELFQFLV